MTRASRHGWPPIEPGWLTSVLRVITWLESTAVIIPLGA